MAFLFFENALPNRAGPALRSTYFNLQDFWHYLLRARTRMEKTAPVMRWSPVGILIELLPPKDVRNVTDWRAGIKALLGSDSLQLYQHSAADPANQLRVWERYSEELKLLLHEPPEPAATLVLRLRAGAVPMRAGYRRLTHTDDVIGTRRTWIELEDPPDREESTSALDAFFDDDLREVHEADAATGAESYDEGIAVLDRDPHRQCLCLDRMPVLPWLCIRPNTYVVTKQMGALLSLQDRPAEDHQPLLRMFGPRQDHAWTSFAPAHVQSWFVLTDGQRPGTEEQRDFVRRALQTPDFMLLEGPPGSGKTTALVELILQLAALGRRILFCASTHVAVDNVIERLKDDRSLHRDKVLIVRIGDEKRVSDVVRTFTLTHIARTERNALLQRLETGPRTRSQEIMFEALRGSKGLEIVERIWLDSAQVICGTTIGVLQHPDIKQQNRKAHGGCAPLFDVVILDEASKTTFAEFLVPALLGRRWIIVGDRRQLSPYVESEWMQVNAAAALPDGEGPELERILLDVFRTRRDPTARALVVADDDEVVRGRYALQAKARFSDDSGAVVSLDKDVNPLALGAARVVIGSLDQCCRMEDALPLRTLLIRAPGRALLRARRRQPALHGPQEKHEQSWAGEVAWRIVRDYERRLLPEMGSAEDGTIIRDQIADLLPASGLVGDAARVEDSIHTIRRVALPSILESLQCGFGVSARQRRVDNVLSAGLPQAALGDRLVRLTYQQRMHPDISRFPRERIYRGEALRDVPDLASKRDWSFRRYAARAVWLDVPGQETAKPPANEKEVDVMMRELSEFAAWARKVRPPEDETCWTAAVLTFYRAQERLLRSRLRSLTMQESEYRSFSLSEGGREFLRIELCTVDRFQGHEADVVYLSCVRTQSAGFLDSPNRLNVAITRARHQLVIVGHWRFLAEGRHSADLLRELAGQMRERDLTF